jgi:hypothetical protein
MTKRSPQTFSAFLDLMQGDPIYANASRALGLHPSCIFRWLKASKLDASNGVQNSEFYFEYGGQTKYLHEFFREVISISVEHIEAAARSRCLGFYTNSMFQGKTVYRTNPDYDDPVLRELLGITDPWLRDEHGDRVPEKIWHPPSTDLVLAVLAAHSKRYRKQSSLSVDLNARVSGGVMVIGQPAQNTITHSVPLPVLEVLEVLDSAEPPLAEPNADGAKPLTDEPDADEQEAEPVALQPRPPPEPPTTPSPAPASAHGPLSPLVADLLRRARMKPDDPDRSAPVKPRDACERDNVGSGAPDV